MKWLVGILERHSAALLLAVLVVAFGLTGGDTFLTGSNFENIDGRSRSMRRWCSAKRWC